MAQSQRRRKWWTLISRGLAPASFSDRRRLQWLLTVLATLLMLALGVWGYDEYDRAHGQQPRFSDNLYHSFALLRLKVDERYRAPGDDGPHELPWQLHVARVLVPLVAFAFGILSLAVFLGVGLQRQSARRMKGHVVVCGDPEVTDTLVRGLLDEGERVVVLRPEPDVRPGVVTHLETLGATMLGGDPANGEVLERAGVRGARVLVAMDRSDLLNIEVILAARHQVEGRRRGSRGTSPEPLHGIAAVHHFPFYQRLLDSDLAPMDGGDTRLSVYAATAAMARAAMLDLSWYRQWRVAEAGEFHAAVFGLGDVGMALLTALARHPGVPGMGQRCITVLAPELDAGSGRPGAALDEMLSGLEQQCPLRRVAFDPDRASPQALVAALGEQAPQVIYVCFEDDDRVFQCLLDLTRAMAVSGLRRSHVRARLSSKPQLTSRWRQITRAGGSLWNIGFFGDGTRFYHPDEVLREAADDSARAIHDAYTRAFGGASEASRNPWERLPEPFRDANRQQADSLAVKLAVLGCEQVSDDRLPRFEPDGDELERLAVAEHERWSAERVSKGWRFGERRDDVHRLHPSLVPYPELSELEQEKDRNAVRSLMLTTQAGARRFVRRRYLCLLPASGDDTASLQGVVEDWCRRQGGAPLVLMTGLLCAAEQRAAAWAVEHCAARIERIVPDCGDGAGDGAACSRAIKAIAATAIGEAQLLQQVTRVLYVPVSAELRPQPDAAGCFPVDVVLQLRSGLQQTLGGACWTAEGVVEPTGGREGENEFRNSGASPAAAGAAAVDPGADPG